MKRKFSITVTVDPETREVTIRDESGTGRTLKSVMLFGGDAEKGAYYLFGWGASADAAWAFRQGFVRAEESGDGGYRNFYRQCACHIAACVAPDAFRREVDPREVLARWSAEEGSGETTH